MKLIGIKSSENSQTDLFNAMEDLSSLNDGEWHKTVEIADNLGLKDIRTKELIALDKLIDNGKAKGKLYRLK